jgi:uncharacterized coiled-coil protein SlyX
VTNELNHVSPPEPDPGVRKGRSPAFYALSLLAFALVVVLGIYETIPVRQQEAAAPPPPDPTTQAIHDLQVSLQRANDQLTGLQQAVLSNQGETKRLSDQVNALARTVEAMQQQSFANAQPPPAVQPTEPARPKRWTR